MPSIPDTSHLPWWLGPSDTPYDAMIKGVQAGSMIRSNQLKTQQLVAETEQNLQRQETNTQLKMMDLGLEQERNDLSKKAFQVRQDTDLTRSRGMTEIGQFLGDATKDNKLTDPETQSNFWKLTSKYAPYINEATVNSMWDNTFKAAMDRKDKADGVSKDTTALKQNSAYLQTLDKNLVDATEAENEAMDLGTPEEQAQATAARQVAERNKQVGFQIAKVQEPGTSPVTVGKVTDADNKEHLYLSDYKGNVHLIKSPKEGLTDLEKMQYAADRRTIQWKLDKGAFDKSEKLDKKESDSVTAARQVKELNNRFSSIGGKTSSGPAQFKFDPSTGSLTPK